MTSAPLVASGCTTRPERSGRGSGRSRARKRGRPTTRSRARKREVTDGLDQVIEDAGAKWAKGVDWYRLPPEPNLVRNVFAAAAGLLDVAFGTHFRSASVETAGSTKFLERHGGAVCAILRGALALPDDTRPAEIWETLGLVRFGHPVCLRAPVPLCRCGGHPGVRPRSSLECRKPRPGGGLRRGRRRAGVHHDCRELDQLQRPMPGGRARCSDLHRRLSAAARSHAGWAHGDALAGSSDLPLGGRRCGRPPDRGLDPRGGRTARQAASHDGGARRASRHQTPPSLQGRGDSPDARQVPAVVGGKGHPGERLGDLGSVRQKLSVSSSPSSGRSGLPMIAGAMARTSPCGCPGTPAVPRSACAEAADIVLVVDVAGEGPTSTSLPNMSGAFCDGEHADHGADRVADEDGVLAGRVRARSPPRLPHSRPGVAYLA